MRGNTKSGTGEREFIASFREGDHIPLSRKRAGVKSRGVIAYFKKSDHIPHAVRGREKSSTAGEDMIATYKKVITSPFIVLGDSKSGGES